MSIFVVTHKQAELPRTDWLVPLGVGGYRDASVQLSDETGHSIAAINRSYCELTATHWIWRNRPDDWVGLCHYRRYFNLLPLQGAPAQGVLQAPATPQTLAFLAAPAQRERLELLLDKFGLVVPAPVTVWPSVGHAFASAHGADIWAAFMSACRDEFGRIATTLEADTRFYPFNMLAARREVFADYATRLFRVIDRVSAAIGDRAPVDGARFQPYRYPAYLGERFTGLYLTATGTPHALASVVCLE